MTAVQLTVEQTYKSQYFQVIDYAVQAINDRFDQKGLQVFDTIESVLTQQSSSNGELEALCHLHLIDYEKLKDELLLFYAGANSR